jgi:hypothetical protein
MEGMRERGREGGGGEGGEGGREGMGRGGEGGEGREGRDFVFLYGKYPLLSDVFLRCMSCKALGAEPT